MKRVNNIYSKIYDIDNIIDYAHIVCVNTANKVKVEKFNMYISENIYHIKDVLASKKYVVGKYNIFLIREPKLRIIMSQSIEDKIVNHLCAKYFLVDVFDKSFVDCSIATRKNKGTHYGIKLLKKYLRAISYRYDNFYVLKFDIKKYFYNMDHEIIKKLMVRKIKDEDTLRLLNDIIDSTDQDYVNECIRNIKRVEIDKILKMPLKEKDKQQQIKELQDLPEYKKGKGFPIGNMSSQIFAIIYLNELDHYIKEKLHIKYYIRYMDDGLLLHQDKKYLEYCLNEIKQILNKYQLELNENKTKINSIKNGIDFLGFRFYMKNKYILMKLRNNTKKGLKLNVKK